MVAEREIPAMDGGGKPPSRSYSIAHIIMAIVVLTGTVGLLFEQTVTILLFL